MHSKETKDKSTNPGSVIPNTLDTIFIYGPQAAGAKRGDLHWHHATFQELTVGADSGENPPENIVPMPPEAATNQDESGEDTETDSQEAENIERLRRFARNFATDYRRRRRLTR